MIYMISVPPRRTVMRYEVFFQEMLRIERENCLDLSVCSTYKNFSKIFQI